MRRSIEIDMSAYHKVPVDAQDALRCYSCPAREVAYDLSEGSHHDLFNYCYPDHLEGGKKANGGCPLGYDKNPPYTNHSPQQEDPHVIFRHMVQNGFK